MRLIVFGVLIAFSCRHEPAACLSFVRIVLPDLNRGERGNRIAQQPLGERPCFFRACTVLCEAPNQFLPAPLAQAEIDDLQREKEEIEKWAAVGAA
jgi:hypothetical protein